MNKRKTPAQQKLVASNQFIRSLKLEEWPEQARLAWMLATQPGSRLKKGGRAAHLAPVTLADLVRRYGQFLDHVRRKYGSLPTDVQQAVTREFVDTYIQELKLRVSSVTVHGSIAKLRSTAEILSPNQDWRWLQEIENELAFDMRPASKFHRVVDTQDIVAVGLKHMASSRAQRNRTRRAEVFRNGLMITLLAVCPIRLRSFAGLVIGKNLIKVGSIWHIKLSALETKERRPDERPLPAFLSPFLDEYLQAHRPVFRYKGHELWCGRTKSAHKINSVAQVITTTTRNLLGKPISPHLFRTCAASTAYRYVGNNPRLASALLGHRAPEVTEQHYNRAQSINFSKRYGALIETQIRNASHNRHQH